MKQFAGLCLRVLTFAKTISGVIEIPQDPEETIVIEPVEVLDTWNKIENTFSEDITQRAKHLTEG